ncbi:MAG: Cof-type HAD-IIB family hydrolase [Lachnospiraceae bacterium]|nr:Cof-type HAD-IIB family hydrolase [Lachnospiraceae bacterium]
MTKTDDRKKILFTDLDETLLSSDKSISPGNLEAIDEMVQKGHKFVIVTGRPLESAMIISKEHGWYREGYYISSYNGGLIYDCYKEENIAEYPVSRQDVRFILDRAYEAGIHAHTYEDGYVVSEHDTKEFRKYIKGIRLPGVVAESADLYLKRDPIKAIVISWEGKEKLEAFRKSIAYHTDGRLAYTYSNPVFLEYSSLMASKGGSVRFLCEKLGIDIADSIGCGDEENDRSMIEAAGCGVLMSNGNMALKDSADYITENDNNHDAIAEVIRKFVL